MNTVFNKNFLECLQIHVSSFLRLSVDISGLQTIKNFSHRHRLHFFVDMRVRSSLSYFSQFYLVIDFAVFWTPYLLAELGYIFVSFVSEGACVISVTFFKCCVAKSDVGFF